MPDLSISYSLNLKEILFFPVVPTYALRHWEKGDWLNRTIGAVCLFPVLGPLCSMIEGIVVTLFRKFCFHKQKEEVNNLFISNDLGVSDEMKLWKKEFKARALAHLKKIQDPHFENKRGAPDITLSPTEEEELKRVIDANTFAPEEGVTLYSKNMYIVFSLDSMPNYVFKILKPDYRPFEFEISKRYEHNKKAHEIVKQHKLNLLIPPEQKYIRLNLTSGSRVSVLVEEKFDLQHGFFSQKSLMNYCLNDPELRPFIKECLKQLIIFIILTGYSDVKFDNNCILSDGTGLTLSDVDCTNSPIQGLKCGRAVQKIGALRFLPLDLFDEMAALIKQKLKNESALAELKLEKMRERVIRDRARDQAFLEYLIKNNITSSRQPITFEASKEEEKDCVTLFTNALNAEISTRLELYTPSEREFVFFVKPVPEALDRLKAEGKIFDWKHKKLKRPAILISGSINEFFYVWC